MVRLTIITGVIQQLYWPLFTNVSLTEVIFLALYNRNIFCSFINHAEYAGISCPTRGLPGNSLNNFLLLLFLHGQTMKALYKTYISLESQPAALISFFRGTTW